MHRRVAHLWILAKTIGIPRDLIRAMTHEFYERWLAEILKKRTRRDEETQALWAWVYGHKLLEDHPLTSFQVQPHGRNGANFTVQVVAKLVESLNVPGRDYAVSGSAHHRNGVPWKITINFTSRMTLADFKAHRAKAEKEIYSILIHEITHAKDFMPQGAGGTSHLDGGAYHNNPREIRAFMQQIWDEVEEWYEARFVKDTFGLTDDPTSTLATALQYSTTWKRIEEDLTPQNRRLVLRTIGQHAIALFDEMGHQR